MERDTFVRIVQVVALMLGILGSAACATVREEAQANRAISSEQSGDDDTNNPNRFHLQKFPDTVSSRSLH